MKGLWRRAGAGLSALLLLFFLFPACDSNRWEVDTDEIEADIDITRFEQELFSIERENFAEQVEALEQQYPLMMELYVEQLLKIGSIEQGNYLPHLEQWVYDPYMRELYDTVQVAFPNLQEAEAEIEEGLRHYKYWYPEAEIPEFYTTITGMTYQVLTYGGEIMVLSPDMFLGEDYKYYPSRGYYEYQMSRFEPVYIKPQVLKALFSMEYPMEEHIDKTLLSEMIYQGKMLYWLDIMAPDMPDSMKIEYTAEQLEWAEENEGQTWAFMVNEGLFYETASKPKERFLVDGPFTNFDGVPQESSPRLGEWVGWQIVRSYMEEHEEMTPQELFRTDYETILQESKYKPRA